MIELKKLNYKTPNVYGEAIVVNEVDYFVNDHSLTPFKASQFIVYPGQASPLDQHEVRETWYIISGKGELTYEGEAKSEALPGDNFYFESFKTHTIRNTGDEDLVIFAIWWNP